MGHAGIITAQHTLKVIIKYPDPSVLKLHLDEASATREGGVPFLYHLANPPVGISLVIDLIANLKIGDAPVH
jgi:hypothetical protein